MAVIGTTARTAASKPGAGHERRIPIPSGRAYRVTGAPERVAPAFAAALSQVLERFASEAGFEAGRRVAIDFRPGVVGHHRVGRAADIYGVGGLSMAAWKQRWDDALCTALRLSPPLAERRLRDECNRNLGWRLYKALQQHGRWSQPYGYPVQLFGPWTRSEGPWIHISDRLLHAHRDHIHVAR